MGVTLTYLRVHILDYGAGFLGACVFCGLAHVSPQALSFQSCPSVQAVVDLPTLDP